MSPDTGESDPLVKPKCASAHHHRSIHPSQDWGILTEDSSIAGLGVLVTPTPRPTCPQMPVTYWFNSKAREQHGRIRPTNFLDLWTSWKFFSVGGPTPSKLGVVYPNIVPTSLWPRHEIPFVADHLESQLSGVHERRRTSTRISLGLSPG